MKTLYDAWKIGVKGALEVVKCCPESVILLSLGAEVFGGPLGHQCPEWRGAAGGCPAASLVPRRGARRGGSRLRKALQVPQIHPKSIRNPPKSMRISPILGVSSRFFLALRRRRCSFPPSWSCCGRAPWRTARRWRSSWRPARAATRWQPRRLLRMRCMWRRRW